MAKQKTETSKTETKSNIDDWKLPTSLIVAALVLWGLCWIILGNSFNECGQGWATRGQFGDMFGAVNALFSGLAFAGIIYTIILQREELKAQREDLKLSRDQMKLNIQELEGQKAEFKTQNITLKRQRFETTFFNMISIHQRIVESFNYQKVTGLEGMQHLTATYWSVIDQWGSKGDEEFLKHYRKHVKLSILHVSPYVQSIVQLHKTIKASFTKEKVKKRYFDVLKTYLTVSERIFLYYYIPHSDNQDLMDLENDLGVVKETILMYSYLYL